MRSIDTTAGHAVVHSDAGTFTGHKVVVAMSPAICDQIDSSWLPAARRELQRATEWGPSPFSAVYKRPFWRRRACRDRCSATAGPSTSLSRATPRTPHPDGFISADAMRRLDHARCRSWRVNAANFADYFGPDARDPLDYGVSNGTSNRGRGWPGRGQLTADPHPIRCRWLRASVGPIHWAGTETSDHWTGYMDGAARSGKRAAGEVLAALQVGNPAEHHPHGKSPCTQ